MRTLESMKMPGGLGVAAAAISRFEEFGALLPPGLDQLLQGQPLLAKHAADSVKGLGRDYFLRGNQHPLGHLDKGDQVAFLEAQFPAYLRRQGYLTFLLNAGKFALSHPCDYSE